eukprot:GHVS01083028.1.p1 GENE.GHVS01083028.1~~GHVS01083028.1.p1  ORF type:complete len:160 (-),score=10.80 GHVS01083028.1:243-650(-)
MSPSARPHAIAPMLVSIPFSYQPQDISSHWTACADSPPAEARLSAVHFNPSSEFAELIKNDTCKMEQTEDSKCLLSIAKALEEVSKQTEDPWSSIQFLVSETNKAFSLSCTCLLRYRFPSITPRYCLTETAITQD